MTREGEEEVRAGARQEVWFGLMDPKTKTKTDCVTDTRSADGEVYLGRAKHSEYCPVLEVPAAPTLQSSPGRQTTETAEAGSGGRHQEKKRYLVGPYAARPQGLYWPGPATSRDLRHARHSAPRGTTRGGEGAHRDGEGALASQVRRRRRANSDGATLASPAGLWWSS